MLSEVLGRIDAGERNLAHSQLPRNLRRQGCVWSSEDRSSDELADTSGSGDTLLGNLGELLGADNAGFGGELALSEDLEEALAQIDY